MTDKKLSRLMQLLELLIQIVTFLSAFIAIYFGALQKPDLVFWKCSFIIVFVTAAYFGRKKIVHFGPFMTIHLFMIAVSFLIGTTDAERFSYLLISGLIAGYSIRLKTITLQKSDISNLPLSDHAEEMGIAEQLEVKKNLMASEQMPFGFCAFMVIGYMVGHAASRAIVMNSEVILFVAFVLLQVVYQDIKKLNTVFLTNQEKQHFPKEQLKRVNTLIIAGTVFLMFLAMLLFYNGEYGNIFGLMGAGGMALLRFVLKVILAVWGSGSEDSGTVMEETTAAQTEEDLGDIEDFYQPSAAASALIEVFGMILMIAAAAGLLYLLYAYAKNFNKKRKPEAYIEEITAIEKNKKSAQKVQVSRKQQQTFSENETVRRLYKKRVLKGTKKNKLDRTLPPEDLTKQTITEDALLSDGITQLYEKARYSDETVTKEEIKQFKEIIKHDLTS